MQRELGAVNVRKINNSFRFIDDLLSLNDDSTFEKHYKHIYLTELELKKESNNNSCASFLDMYIYIENGEFHTKLFDKLDNFGFNIVRVPFYCSNIPSKMFCGRIGVEFPLFLHIVHIFIHFLIHFFIQFFIHFLYTLLYFHINLFLCTLLYICIFSCLYIYIYIYIFILCTHYIFVYLSFLHISSLFCLFVSLLMFHWMLLYSFSYLYLLFLLTLLHFSHLYFSSCIFVSFHICIFVYFHIFIIVCFHIFIHFCFLYFLYFLL